MSEQFLSASLSLQNIQPQNNEAEYKKADRGECYSPLLKAVEGNSLRDVQNFPRVNFTPDLNWPL